MQYIVLLSGKFTAQYRTLSNKCQRNYKCLTSCYNVLLTRLMAGGEEGFREYRTCMCTSSTSVYCQSYKHTHVLRSHFELLLKHINTRAHTYRHNFESDLS
jgi:hypothetical protein